ncbi:MAG: isochorismatase [Anaerolineales bacterium]|nr:isochorismatase [Anaerolineales bacterium]
MCTLTLRSRRLTPDEHGYLTWRVRECPARLIPSETALVLCDVWDRHWCRGANERLERMLPRMAAVVEAARSVGVLIVHAPSDTMAFYRDSPARQRVWAAPPIAPPADLLHDDPALPVDAADGGCDTLDNVAGVDVRVWTRQHPAIRIDEDQDAISDSGQELYSLYQHVGIRTVILMGVHTNMCILHRSFAIKQMVRWGFAVALVRDLTDTMYNPARPPYVAHAEGTRLTVEFIERFWCPTIESRDLIQACGGQCD